MRYFADLDGRQPSMQSVSWKRYSGCERVDGIDENVIRDTHTLSSLVERLKTMIVGRSSIEHDVEGVRREICKWNPRPEEWARYVYWDADKTKYTRNLMFANEHMDVILMCWPAGSSSTIHDHDESSCWAYCVEGEMTEVQFHMPAIDRLRDTAEGAVGQCTRLEQKKVTVLTPGNCGYVCNSVGLHQVCNRTDRPAFTMHVYAPGLKTCKVFAEYGRVSVFTLPRKDDIR